MPTESLGPASAPRPGDPRSTGPRPPARRSDIAWLALAVALVGLTAVQFVGLFVALLRLEVRISGGGMLVGFLITTVWLLTIWWFTMGAWRRTVWGCPFDHVEAAATPRRCPRHATVHPNEPVAPRRLPLKRRRW